MTFAAAVAAAAVAASLQQSSSLGNIILVGAVIFGAWAVWRTKSGDFYKTALQEKKDENQSLRAENTRLKELTDITPIVTALEGVTEALERHSKVTEAVFSRVEQMNGSLRATTTAMEALGERLVLDEAARALLRTAAEKPSTASERRTS